MLSIASLYLSNTATFGSLCGWLDSLGTDLGLANLHVTTQMLATPIDQPRLDFSLVGLSPEQSSFTFWRTEEQRTTGFFVHQGSAAGLSNIGVFSRCAPGEWPMVPVYVDIGASFTTRRCVYGGQGNATEGGTFRVESFENHYKGDSAWLLRDGHGGGGQARFVYDRFDDSDTLIAPRVEGSHNLYVNPGSSVLCIGSEFSSASGYGVTHSSGSGSVAKWSIYVGNLFDKDVTSQLHMNNVCPTMAVANAHHGGGGIGVRVRHNTSATIGSSFTGQFGACVDDNNQFADTAFPLVLGCVFHAKVTPGIIYRSSETSSADPLHAKFGFWRVSHCTFENFWEGDGYGLFQRSGATELSDCLFLKSAVLGGHGRVSGGEVTLRNSRVLDRGFDVTADLGDVSLRLFGNRFDALTNGSGLSLQPNPVFAHSVNVTGRDNYFRGGAPWIDPGATDRVSGTLRPPPGDESVIADATITISANTDFVRVSGSTEIVEILVDSGVGRLFNGATIRYFFADPCVCLGHSMGAKSLLTLTLVDGEWFA